MNKRFIFVASDQKHVIVDIRTVAEEFRKRSKEAEKAKQNVVTKICELGKAAWNANDENEKKAADAKTHVDEIVKEQVLILYSSVLFVSLLFSSWK